MMVERVTDADGSGERKETGGGGDKVPFSSSFTVERVFKVDGKRVVVKGVIPAAAAKAIGMETTWEVASRILLQLESKEARVEESKNGAGSRK